MKKILLYDLTGRAASCQADYHNWELTELLRHLFPWEIMWRSEGGSGNNFATITIQPRYIFFLIPAASAFQDEGEAGVVTRAISSFKCNKIFHLDPSALINTDTIILYYM